MDVNYHELLRCIWLLWDGFRCLRIVKEQFTRHPLFLNKKTHGSLQVFPQIIVIRPIETIGVHMERTYDLPIYSIYNKHLLMVSSSEQSHRHRQVKNAVALDRLYYPLVIKHGIGESPINGGFSRKITDKCPIFHCHVWLPEGNLKYGVFGIVTLVQTISSVTSRRQVVVNNVLLAKIEGPGTGIPSIIIYLLQKKGWFQAPLFSSTNQWEFGTSMVVTYPDGFRLDNYRKS